MDELVNSLVGKKTAGLYQSKQKNKSAYLAKSAGPTFSQHFTTQVSPHYPQLEPIYFVLREQTCVIIWTFHMFFG